MMNSIRRSISSGVMPWLSPFTIDCIIRRGITQAQRSGLRSMIRPWRSPTFFAAGIPRRGSYGVRERLVPREKAGQSPQFEHTTRKGLVTASGNRNDELAPGTLKSILKAAGLKHGITWLVRRSTFYTSCRCRKGKVRCDRPEPGGQTPTDPRLIRLAAADAAASSSRRSLLRREG